MDEETDSTIALFAIHPEFAERILSGQKKVEFRKRRPKENISHVLVYATSPLKKVLGYFHIEHVDEGSPDEIWSRYGHIGGIEESAFDAYFADSDVSVAIVIKEAKSFDEPVGLECLNGPKAPPQSFQYLPTSTLKLLPI